ncbi:hypothetical protein P3T76_013659 [Phytophthora citrophthora]|uniref:Uncharacterized protein n=1 Tax=Phytophthora citrophthora TaxID=4793 RepID=A0AAD9G3E6_9STRA|nr:hypothetical protein P3T76_013659 [Phytophthora citrophthora]
MTRVTTRHVTHEDYNRLGRCRVHAGLAFPHGIPPEHSGLEEPDFSIGDQRLQALPLHSVEFSQPMALYARKVQPHASTGCAMHGPSRKWQVCRSGSAVSIHVGSPTHAILIGEHQDVSSGTHCGECDTADLDTVMAN